jgi:hypothetical protein
VQAGLAAHHVGVEPGAADLLAHLVDEQQVHVSDRQPGEQVAGLEEQLCFPPQQVRRRHGRDSRRAVVAALDQRHTGQDGQPVEQPGQGVGEHGREPEVGEGPVVRGGPLVLAEPDHEHLGQAALDRADLEGVGLDPVDDHQVIGRGVRSMTNG